MKCKTISCERGRSMNLTNVAIGNSTQQANAFEYRNQFYASYKSGSFVNFPGTRLSTPAANSRLKSSAPRRRALIVADTLLPGHFLTRVSSRPVIGWELDGEVPDWLTMAHHKFTCGAGKEKGRSLILSTCDYQRA